MISHFVFREGLPKAFRSSCSTSIKTAQSPFGTFLKIHGTTISPDFPTFPLLLVLDRSLQPELRISRTALVMRSKICKHFSSTRTPMGT